MNRPVTLFTGQWADLPLEELAAKGGRWGFDGLELACWGDHFEVDRAVAEPGYATATARAARAHGLSCFAIGAHLVGQAVCDPIDERHRAILPPDVWGDGDAGGRSRPRGRANEGHRPRRGAARRDAGERLHRVGDLAPALLVPAQRLRGDRARLRRVRRALGADHRRLRCRGRALRPRGAPDRDRLRLRDDPEGRSTRSETARLRHQPRPEPLRAPVPRHGAVRAGVRRPDLPRARQGLAQAARRTSLDPRLAPELRRGGPRLGLRLAGARRRRLRGVLPGAEPDRLPGAAVDRVGGQREWTASRARRTRSRSCAAPISRPLRWPSTRRCRRRARELPAGARRRRERAGDMPEIGIGMLGYAFMGKAHSNGSKTSRT